MCLAVGAVRFCSSSINSVFIYLHSFLVLFMCFPNFLICSYPFFVRLKPRRVLFFLFVLCVCVFVLLCVHYLCAICKKLRFSFYFASLRSLLRSTLIIHSGSIMYALGRLLYMQNTHPMKWCASYAVVILSLSLSHSASPLMETSRARLPRFHFGWRGILPRFLSVCFRQTIYANFGKFPVLSIRTCIAKLATERILYAIRM